MCESRERGIVWSAWYPLDVDLSAHRSEWTARASEICCRIRSSPRVQLGQTGDSLGHVLFVGLASAGLCSLYSCASGCCPPPVVPESSGLRCAAQGVTANDAAWAHGGWGPGVRACAARPQDAKQQGTCIRVSRQLVHTPSDLARSSDALLQKSK